MGRKRGTQHYRPGRTRKSTRTPLLHRIVGTSAGILALAVAPVGFLVAGLSVAFLGTYNDLAMPALAVGATAALLGLGLAMVNGIGIRPWIDDSGRFARPSSGIDWAVKLLGLAAVVLFLLAIVPIGPSVALPSSEDGAALLGVLVLGGVAASLLLAAVGGGLQLARDLPRSPSSRG